MELFKPSYDPTEWDLVSEPDSECEYFFVNTESDKEFENDFHKFTISDTSDNEDAYTYISDCLMFSFQNVKHQIENLQKQKDFLNSSLIIPRRRIQEKIDKLKEA